MTLNGQDSPVLRRLGTSLHVSLYGQKLAQKLRLRPAPFYSTCTWGPQTTPTYLFQPLTPSYRLHDARRSVVAVCSSSPEPATPTFHSSTHMRRQSQRNCLCAGGERRKGENSETCRVLTPHRYPRRGRLGHLQTVRNSIIFLVRLL